MPDETSISQASRHSEYLKLIKRLTGPQRVELFHSLGQELSSQESRCLRERNRLRALRKSMRAIRSVVRYANRTRYGKPRKVIHNGYERYCLASLIAHPGDWFLDSKYTWVLILKNGRVFSRYRIWINITYRPLLSKAFVKVKFLGHRAETSDIASALDLLRIGGRWGGIVYERQGFPRILSGVKNISIGRKLDEEEDRAGQDSWVLSSPETEGDEEDGDIQDFTEGEGDQ